MEGKERVFLGGVVEGFYGRPWTPQQRRTLMERMEEWKLNAFMYAPKDDLKHRALWREKYSENEAKELSTLIAKSKQHKVNFIYAIAPGLDIKYSSEQDWTKLQEKMSQMIDLGCRSFAFLFDDIPKDVSVADQCTLTNNIVSFIKSKIHDAPGHYLFCPTPYCGMMARPSIQENTYLTQLGSLLDPEVAMFWTGPDIISQEITASSIAHLKSIVRRPIIIWDNLHADDYDIRRVYLGPYSGRAVQLRREVLGILSNPNCEFELNFVPLRTLGLYVSASEETGGYHPEQALAQGVKEWLPHFTPAASDPYHCCHVPSEREVTLLCDLFYLPYSHGTLARQFISDLQSLFTQEQNQQQDLSEWNKLCEKVIGEAKEIADLFHRMTEIGNRDLLYSVYGYLWGAKEEAILIGGYVKWLQEKKNQANKKDEADKKKIPEEFVYPGLEPKVYRGGIVADLERILWMSDKGTFHHQPTRSASECYVIRSVNPHVEKDYQGVYAVCLNTGDSGKDGTHLFPEDAMALGHRYVGPYIFYQTDTALCLEDQDGTICGYCLSALDSETFYERFRKEWLPHLRNEVYQGKLEDPAKKEPDRSKWKHVENVYHEFFEPNIYLPDGLKADYPSHLHIDIIAKAQRKGMGTRLINRQLALLKERGSKGVHLEMSDRNHNAYAFYKTLGFEELGRREGCIYMEAPRGRSAQNGPASLEANFEMSFTELEEPEESLASVNAIEPVPSTGVRGLIRRKTKLIVGLTLLFTVIAIVVVFVIALSISLATSDDSSSRNGDLRTYYIQSQEIMWNYVPSGYNLITNANFSASESFYTTNDRAHLIGREYKKCVYREYTGSDFTIMKPHPPSLGLLGPTIYAEVYDTIHIVFRNNCSFPFSIHPHGVFYNESAEGATYAGRNSPGAQVAPNGGTYEYVWQVPERSGPSKNDGSSIAWLYHSHVNEIADTNAGLVGGIVIAKPGRLARVREGSGISGTQAEWRVRGRDEEYLSLWTVVDENTSPYLDENIGKYIDNVTTADQVAALKKNAVFIAANRKHAVNGMLYGNLPEVRMKKGDEVRWYLLSLGSEVDLHTPHWHGQTVVEGEGMRRDVVDLLPGDAKVVDMEADNVGTWLWHCHVNDHLKDGMVALFQVTKDD